MHSIRMFSFGQFLLCFGFLPRHTSNVDVLDMHENPYRVYVLLNVPNSMFLWLNIRSYSEIHRKVSVLLYGSADTNVHVLYTCTSLIEGIRVHMQCT